MGGTRLEGSGVEEDVSLAVRNHRFSLPAGVRQPHVGWADSSRRTRVSGTRLTYPLSFASDVDERESDAGAKEKF